MNNPPYFSVIIPTRQRHQTLYYSIQTVLVQNFKNFELVVMDNCSSDETHKTVQKFADPRISYYRSEQRLSMTENWEVGLSKANGQYITIMGDDDGLLPTALHDCFNLIQKFKLEIVSWYRWPYFWPNAPQQRNSLYIPLLDQPKIIKSHDILKKAYQSLVSYQHLPSLYNSFVSRQLIEKVKIQNNGMFYPENCFCPDVFSGLVNAFFCDSFLWKNQPFSVSGISGFSNLSAATVDTSQSAKQWRLEESKKQIHPSLNLKENIDIASQITIISDFLWAKQIFFNQKHDIKLNLNRAIQVYLLDRANDDPVRYEQCLNVANQLIGSFKLNMECFEIPRKSHHRVPLHTPSRFMGNFSSPSGIILNCDTLGIYNVHAAVNLSNAVMKGDIPYIIDRGKPSIDPILAFELISNMYKKFPAPDLDSRITYF